MIDTTTIGGSLEEQVPNVMGALQEGARSAAVELDSVNDVLASMANRLANIAFAAGTNPLFALLQKSASTAVAKYFAGDVKLSSGSASSTAVEHQVLAGKARGGTAYVKGRGSGDSTLVSFMATPGEQITVRPVGSFAHGGVISVGGGGGAAGVQIIDQRGAGAPAITTTVSSVKGQRVLQAIIRDQANVALGEAFRSHSIDPVMAGAYGVRRRGVARG
jgi:hypothetical protein